MSASIQLPSDLDLDLDIDLEAKTVALTWSFKTRTEAVAAFKAIKAMGETGGTRKVKSGKSVTVSCAEGDIGQVYEGALPFDIECVPSAAGDRAAVRLQDQ